MLLNTLTAFSDITTSHLLTAVANATLVQLAGFHPWGIQNLEHYVKAKGKSEPVLSLHYVSGKMQQLMDIVDKHSKTAN